MSTRGHLMTSHSGSLVQLPWVVTTRTRANRPGNSSAEPCRQTPVQNTRAGRACAKVRALRGEYATSRQTRTQRRLVAVGGGGVTG